MAATHPTAVRNSVADFTLAKLNASGAGRLKFRLAGSANAPGTAAATLLLSATAFAAAANGVATANAIASDTNAAGNASAVANATLEAGDGTVVVHFSVAASGADLNLANGLVIGAGDTVSCSSLTYTAMP